MRVETTRRYERQFESLPLAVQDQVLDALPGLVAAFGQPHRHLGLRKLGGQLYEFRVGLRLRLVFRQEPEVLYLLLIGTHDEVRRFIRSL